jgi:hypothetical protein
MSVVSVEAQGLDDYLSRILQAVQKNVDSQKEQIIDIISREEITIEEFDDKGKTRKTTNVISNYHIFPETTSSIPDCRIVTEILASVQPAGILREERTMLSAKVDNKAQRMDRFRFTEDIWAKGNSYVDLFILFDKQNEKCFEYRLIGKFEEDNVYAIVIKQKENDIGKSNRWQWDLLYEGVALIDAVTMEIVQLIRNKVPLTYYNISRDGDNAITKNVSKRQYFFTQIEYDKIKIGNQFLTLPVERTVRLFRADGQLDTVYKYRYSDHKAFAVDTKISFDPIDEPSIEELQMRNLPVYLLE